MNDSQERQEPREMVRTGTDAMHAAGMGGKVPEFDTGDFRGLGRAGHDCTVVNNSAGI
jgi:hypothetical protein